MSSLRCSFFLVVLVQVFLSGCEKSPKLLKEDRKALSCMVSENNYFEYQGEFTVVRAIDDEEFDNKCEGASIKVDAFFIERDGNEAKFYFKDPLQGNYAEPELVFIGHFNTSARKGYYRRGDKLRISGIVDDRTFFGSHTEVKKVSVVKMELTDDEASDRENYKSPRERARLRRLEAMNAKIEADQELAKYADSTRAKLSKHAVDVVKRNTNGILVEQYKMPDGTLHTCEMTWPGPVYTCNVVGPNSLGL